MEEYRNKLSRDFNLSSKPRDQKNELTPDSELLPRLKIGNRQFLLRDIGSESGSIDSETFNTAAHSLECELIFQDRNIFRGKLQAPVFPQTEIRPEAIEFSSRSAPSELPRTTSSEPGESIGLQSFEDHHLEIEALPSTFKDSALEIATFLRICEKIIQTYETTHSRSEPENDSRKAHLENQLFQQLIAPWKEIYTRASKNGHAVLRDKGLRKIGKELAESLITPLIVDCPLPRRAYQKPLGYAGDFKVMEFCYENRFEGNNLRSKIIHKLFASHPLASGISTRCQFVTNILFEAEKHFREATRRHPQEFRYMSLACGSAREVSAFIGGRSERSDKVRWTLVDQEEQALDLANRRCSEALRRNGVNDSIHIVHSNFLSLIRNPTVANKIEAQDFICSIGLFDYLKKETATRLVAWLFDHLRPNGCLLIGNAKGPNDHYWLAEFVLDWSLIYRTESEMLELAKGLPSSATAEVLLEPGGAYYFLKIVRAPN